jgi:hypothetical protein
MVEHLVLFQFNELITPEKEEELVQKLLSFKGRIPGLVEITAGLNVTEEIDKEQGYRLGLRATFENQEALRAYATHPVHEEFHQLLKDVVKNVIVADYPIS